MHATFNDREEEGNPFNGMIVDSEDKLGAVLKATGRQPYFCELEANGQTLLIGVGTNHGCVQISSSDGMPPYWMAVGRSPSEGKELEFLIGGTPTPVSDRYKLTMNEVRYIVMEFLNSGNRSTLTNWEEI